MSASEEPRPDREPPRPSLGELLERSPTRLLIEAVLGATGGLVLASLLPEGEGRAAVFGLVGAAATTLALMLTPVRGSGLYRALRYGAALGVLATLVLSFAAGTELFFAELLAFGLLVFGIGAIGHGAMLASVDRDPGEG